MEGCGVVASLLVRGRGFDFTPLRLAETTIAQNGSDQSQPGTGNEPVSVTPGESKTKEEGSLAKAA